jgi:RNA recognition motif-containing protein
LNLEELSTMSETDTKEETTAPAAAGEETTETPDVDSSEGKESEPSKEDATTTEKVEEKAKETSEGTEKVEEKAKETSEGTEKVEEKAKENSEGKSSEDGPAAKKQKLEEEMPKSDEKDKNEEPEEVKAYEIDEAPTAPSTDDDKINSPAVVLFGLHPLIKEAPLSKLLENYGALKSCSVRMAFASRYGSVEFETTDQAKAAYRALNNAKIMGKPILVKPTVVRND